MPGCICVFHPQSELATPFFVERFAKIYIRRIDILFVDKMIAAAEVIHSLSVQQTVVVCIVIGSYKTAFQTGIKSCTFSQRMCVIHLTAIDFDILR